MLKAGLLATKLHRPALPLQWVQRPHLGERLDQGLALQRKVTLVSAPAGFGKTTCVASWLHSLDGRPVAWLSLDPADDDPARFFTYLVAALQQVDASLGREIGGILRAGQLPPGEVLAATLVNEMAAEPLVLVLDDFHVIQDRFILQVLETLVANLPAALHLVLITREDPPLPLARLRANNQLTEVRARDLRFDSEDVTTFLNEVMGLSLTAADIGALEVKTEGWIAGLQLAALALQTAPDPGERATVSNFIAALSGSHRFILSYLTEQVLNQQPEDVQRFLLQTAILDKLNGDLCEAVTGRSGSQALLERLYRANLFLIALDEEGRWYRYHHLFADLLRDRLGALHQDENAELHRRASRWYAAATGDGGAFASAAVEHALAAGDYEMAVDLLEQHGMAMVMQGYAQTVSGWVQALPPEWRAASPRTELAFAWMHLLRGAYAEAAPYLERTKLVVGGEGAEIPATQAEQVLKAEWLVMRSLQLFRHGKALESMALAKRALKLAPETDGRVRSLAYWAVASVQQLVAAYTDATESYRMAIQCGRAADNAVAEMMAVSGLVQMALEQGHLQRSFEIATEAVERIARAGVLPPISAVAYGALAQIYYEWHELDRARRYGQRALELSTLGGYNSGIAGCRAFLSRLYQLEGDLEMAAGAIQLAVDLVQRDAPAYIRQEVVAQQVRVFLAQERLAAAQLVLQGDGLTFPELPDGARITHSSGLLYNSSLQLLLARARASGDGDQLAAGIQLAGRIIAAAREGRYRLVELEALLLRAQMHAERGSAVASAVDYAAALALAAPERVIGIFLDQGPRTAEALVQLRKLNTLGSVETTHAARILEAFARLPLSGSVPAPQAATGAPSGTLVEPLTERELEVLNLMAEGLKYQEIATRLFISLNTVRFHVKAIYGKLNVHKRGQAVAVARQRGLL